MGVGVALAALAGQPDEAMTAAENPLQVVYLLGAGASHACAKAVDSAHGILMRDLGAPLREQVRALVMKTYADDAAIKDLANTVITDDVDIEHIITFLDESTSSLHRQFANDLRHAFERVLKERLAILEEELGSPPVQLYEALIDMHDVDGFSEELRGILTLNYDEYIEIAIRNLDRGIDFGIHVEGNVASPTMHKLIKLHGSFGWKYSWPVSIAAQGEDPLWIPPGIQKAKGNYPFNALWGLARELLDCDVLRIIGCRLGANDWDLISLLFTTRHTNTRRAAPYRIEVINSPRDAEILRNTYPYLEIRSIFDTARIGSRLVAELLGGDPRPYDTLTTDEQEELHHKSENANWFRLWLQHMAEDLYEMLGSVTTPIGALERLMRAV